MGQVYLKAILKKQEKPKSKLGLPRVTIKGRINLLPKVSEVTQKKVNCTSTNGPPRNYRGALEVNLKTCAKGTKLRVYIWVINEKQIWVESSRL